MISWPGLDIFCFHFPSIFWGKNCVFIILKGKCDGILSLILCHNYIILNIEQFWWLQHLRNKCLYIHVSLWCSSTIKESYNTFAMGINPLIIVIKYNRTSWLLSCMLSCSQPCVVSWIKLLFSITWLVDTFLLVLVGPFAVIIYVGKGKF